MSLEPYKQPLNDLAKTGNLNLIDQVETLGYDQIAKQYPDSPWAPTYPLKRFLAKKEWGELIRQSRAEAMKVAAILPLRLFTEQTDQIVQEEAFAATLDQTRRMTRMGADERLYEAEGLARVAQGQGNVSPLDLAMQFIDKIKSIEDDKTLTEDQKDRRVQLLKLAMSEQVKK